MADDHESAITPGPPVGASFSAPAVTPRDTDLPPNVSRIVALQADNDNLLKQVATLQDQIDDLLDENASLRSTNDSLTAQVAYGEANLASRDSYIANLKQRRSAPLGQDCKRCAELAAKLATLRGQLDARDSLPLQRQDTKTADVSILIVQQYSPSSSPPGCPSPTSSPPRACPT